ncbi:MAG: NAD(P)-binding protein [Pseudomonadota bacterium]
MTTIETDYLIMGAGASGLAFADEMLTRSDHHMTIVDKRHAPGGHWNDAYPFVALHQPSAFYGVESKELSNGRHEMSGPNEGMMSLAPGPQVTDYFHSIMRDRLLPSGRDSYFPMSEVTEDGKIRSLMSGETMDVHVRRKTVDATIYTNIVPKTHTPAFSVAEGVTCVPPNELPRLAANYERFVVMGVGKTGLDAVCFLIANGMDPEKISLVAPRDPWLWNRATTQPSEAFFHETFGGFADRQAAIAEASSARDFAHRMEAAGVWLRIDPDVEPGFYHGATSSLREVEMIRRVGEIIRKGRVKEINTDKLVLDQGEVTVVPGTLFIDCTASAIRPRPVVPVFDGDRVSLQMIRFPQIPFSCALIAFIETLIDDEAQKNLMCAPIPMPDTVEEYMVTLLPDMMNRYHGGQNKEVRAWINESRLEGYAKIARSIPREDDEKMAVFNRIRELAVPAVTNVQKIIAEQSA